MCRKLTYSLSFVLTLGLVLTIAAENADAALIGWWKLDEGSGDVTSDSSGLGAAGAITNVDTGGLGTGGTVWVNDPERGIVISFNGEGSSAYVRAGDIPQMTLTNDFAWAFWAKQDAGNTTPNDIIFGNRVNEAGADFAPRQFIKFTPTKFEFHMNANGNDNLDYDDIPADVWLHHVVVKAGNQLTYYRDGVEAGSKTITQPLDVAQPLYFGGDNQNASGENWRGFMSDVRIYDHALTPAEVLGAMQGSGEAWPYASAPNPADGALHGATWVNVSWRPGGYAVSHDVYLGDNLDEVTDADSASPVFQGNQGGTFIIAGFVGFPYPDGLVPGTTYYWRVDEVNDSEPNSPWKGDVWSFSIPPKTAYNPDPANGAEFVDPDAILSWAGGYGARLHTVYFGDNYDDVSNATAGTPSAMVSHDPGTLEREKVLYWRVDESDGIETQKGNIWAFTTPGAVGNPQPANGAVDVQINATLSWTAAETAASHELYFGTDADAVRNATTASPEYIGPRALGAVSYDPGGLAWDGSYAWRVDEVYPDKTVKGLVWTFATADFIAVDDFESYNDIDPPDPASNRVFDKWIDGFGTTTNGALVGNDLPPYAEQTIVHGGAQSMPYVYDNNLKTSEATLTLVYPRDWTAEGVTRLSLWFRGSSGNSAERMFIALNGNSVVYHDDASATQIAGWTEWVIDLTDFTGVALTNVNTITIGFGTKGSPVAGGSGQMYFDDIQLRR
jgi:hypothetical protein